MTAALLLSALACASPGNTIAANSAQPPTAPTALVTADTADVVITVPDGTTAVRVGQTVGVKLGGDDARWQVSFSNTALELLTPVDRLPSPGSDGWVWRALAAGTTEITLTSTVACGPPPCSPNVQRFTLTIAITGS